MTFRVSEFSSILSKVSPARPNRFAVQITPPNGLTSPISNDLMMLSNSANLPGSNFGLDVVKHKGYGLDEKRPNSLSLDDITLTIIADGRGQVLDFLHKWYEKVFSTDEDSTNSETFNYPVEYWGTLDIYLYDTTGGTYTTYTMSKAYPVVVGSVQLAWENNDQLMLIPVTFTYRNYKRNSSYIGFSNPVANDYVNITTDEYQQRITS